MPDDDRDPTIRFTYTKLADLDPPPRGAIVRLSGFVGDVYFRVTNEPEVAEDGSFSIEVEPKDAVPVPAFDRSVTEQVTPDMAVSVSAMLRKAIGND